MEFLIKHKKSRNIKLLEVEGLKKLNTKRLLSFYKKERISCFRFSGSMHCGCCGELYSNMYPDDKFYTEEQPRISTEWKLYLKQIKEELDKREHIN